MLQKISDKNLFIILVVLLIPSILGSLFFRTKLNGLYESQQQRIQILQEIKYQITQVSLLTEKWHLNEKSNNLSVQVYPIFDDINAHIKVFQFGGRTQNFSVSEVSFSKETENNLKKLKDQLAAYELTVKNLWKTVSEQADSATQEKTTALLEKKVQLSQALTNCLDLLKELNTDLNTSLQGELMLTERVITLQIIILLLITFLALVLLRKTHLREASGLHHQAEALSKQENLNKISEFIRQIAQKNYATPYSENDILGKELMTMRDGLAKSDISVEMTIKNLEGTKKILEDKNFQLQQAEEEMRVLNEELSIRQRYIEEQNSTRVNVVKLDEFLRANFNKDLTDFGDLLMAEMAKQTGCAQAILYIISSYEATSLELVGGYACERDKLPRTVKLGEGLIGQSTKSLKFMEFNNIKANNTTLSTGLVSIAPTSIVIVPLEQNGIPQGAMEFSFMEQPTEQTIQFLKACNQSISSILINIVNTSRTKRLLEEYQHISEQLQAQTEELRQNAEEMLATQEEFKRTRDEEIRKYDDDLQVLRLRLAKYETEPPAET